ncbi:restriction endonuclease [Pseudanabaena yagii]|uniref:Restriction endonuclease n=1 Tax=Pseudanabaena yagii GIHE-NHR1 TaxID=2722753 RepID=A0ABX1LR76_9CYAN|nr:restriction endonuclease [Pseudanabaena yagii]NMF57299.1 restriction endonuclease [Pseudanabaena yagii GIHE-NHR1]
MPTPSTSDLPKPKSWDEFEDIVWEIYTRRWQDPYAQRYGRHGQAQNGVDIYGRQSNSDKNIAVQCKRFEDKSFKPTTITSEVEKTKKFTHPISEYLIATTTSRDTEIQNFVMKLTQERTSENKFPVHVIFWDDLCSYLAEPSNYDLLKKHYPIWVEIFKKPQDAGSVTLSNRIKKISFWQNEIDKCNNDDDIHSFFQSRTYAELNELLTKEEKEEISKLSQVEATEIIESGGITHIRTPSSRQFDFYKKVIFRLECEWNII